MKIEVEGLQSTAPPQKEEMASNKDELDFLKTQVASLMAFKEGTAKDELFHGIIYFGELGAALRKQLRCPHLQLDAIKKRVGWLEQLTDSVLTKIIHDRNQTIHS